jgi:hypothetical protein
MNLEHGSGGASQALDFVPIFFEQREALLRALRCLHRSLFDAVQEKLRPSLPVARCPHTIEQLVLLAMRLKVEAEVKNRLADGAGNMEQERDEQSSQAGHCRPGKGGLDVRQRRLNKHR